MKSWETVEARRKRVKELTSNNPFLTVQHKANTDSSLLELTSWALCITWTGHLSFTLSSGKDGKYQGENLQQKRRFDDLIWRRTLTYQQAWHFDTAAASTKGQM